MAYPDHFDTRAFDAQWGSFADKRCDECASVLNDGICPTCTCDYCRERKPEDTMVMEGEVICSTCRVDTEIEPLTVSERNPLPNVTFEDGEVVFDAGEQEKAA